MREFINSTLKVLNEHLPTSGKIIVEHEDPDSVTTLKVTPWFGHIPFSAIMIDLSGQSLDLMGKFKGGALEATPEHAQGKPFRLEDDRLAFDLYCVSTIITEDGRVYTADPERSRRFISKLEQDYRTNNPVTALHKKLDEFKKLTMVK